MTCCHVATTNVKFQEEPNPDKGEKDMGKAAKRQKQAGKVDNVKLILE